MALDLHTEDGLLLAQGRRIPLTAREQALLAVLTERRGHVVRREELYRRVWGGDLPAGDRCVDVYVRKLRAKLAQALPDWRFIHTHVGFGYRLEPERSPAFHSGATAR